MESAKQDNLRSIVQNSLGIALVALATMVIRIPTIKGYVNFGDIMIFTIAILFGGKRGFLAGAIGSALADIIGGYFLFAPGTFVIKGIEGLVCALIYSKSKNIGKLSLSLATITSGIWMALGYLVYEYFIYGGAAAAAGIPGNLFQGIVSGIAAIPLIMVFKKNKTILNFSK